MGPLDLGLILIFSVLVVLIGDNGVGKSNFLSRVTRNEFGPIFRLNHWYFLFQWY